MNVGCWVENVVKSKIPWHLRPCTIRVAGNAISIPAMVPGELWKSFILVEAVTTLLPFLKWITFPNYSSHRDIVLAVKFHHHHHQS
jgi:hypothetical protein